MKIAVFGGTFNPFHIGHFQIAKALCDMEFFNKVIIMPDSIPPHKKADFLASDEDRLNMCKIACKDLNKAEISTLEIENGGKSYTINTIRKLKETYKNDDFYFVCGADMIEILDKWYDFENLKNETEFLAFSRNDSKEFQNNVKLMRNKGAKIEIIDTPITDVSSTSLRKNLNKDLLPKGVYEYILEKGIYNAR